MELRFVGILVENMRLIEEADFQKLKRLKDGWQILAD
jgi:hypothetical protein